MACCQGIRRNNYDRYSYWRKISVIYFASGEPDSLHEFSHLIEPRTVLSLPRPGRLMFFTRWAWAQVWGHDATTRRTVLSLPRADLLIFFTPWSWSHDADISAAHKVCPYTGFDDSGNDFIFKFKFNVIPIDIELKISQHTTDDQLQSWGPFFFSIQFQFRYFQFQFHYSQ